MKKIFTPLIFLILSIWMTSCVSKIDIPEDGESKLSISLEMLRGENKIVANLSTTNDLNGSSPITFPENARVTVNQDGKDETITLVYDPANKNYVGDVFPDYLAFGKNFKLNAVVLDSELPEISSITKVPSLTKIEEYELINEGYEPDIHGNEFWQGTVGITFAEAFNNADRYGQLIVSGYETKIVETVDGPEPVFGSEMKLFDLIKVTNGNAAVTDILHRDGFLIDLTELEDNYLEIIIRSPFPLSENNTLTSMLQTEMISVTKEHFDYHLAFHNIRKSQNAVFNENPLYRSNIKNGLGLFSSCTTMSQILELK